MEKVVSGQWLVVSKTTPPMLQAIHLTTDHRPLTTAFLVESSVLQS
jgi:hypothetical protein